MQLMSRDPPSVDTEFCNSWNGNVNDDCMDLQKRNAIGTYGHSGWPSYEDRDGDGFPDEWKVRFTLAAGVVSAPAHHEQFQVHIHGRRQPAVEMTGSHHQYTVHVPNPNEDQDGMYKSGTLPVSESVGVHSMQDVPVFTQGPGSELFRGVMDNTQSQFSPPEINKTLALPIPFPALLTENLLPP
ncbi:hypothetical protein DFQ27_003739 [Actinomortierella ambigua]|uniref:Uncharacterized protein n=1 Tax=Actinomortierella ambigua TaxID=1343610 RepID=A0A9P6Q611_9FUNG|nr:hypothetical protein DFQ27_003739 [Actinomortierella ambigua]